MEQTPQKVSHFSNVFVDQFSYKNVSDKVSTAIGYEVSAVRNDEDAVRFVIVETGNSCGGSYFIVVQQQGLKLHRRTICPYVDHFNGTYSITCAYYDSEYSDITVTVNFSGFAHLVEGFQGLGRNEMLWNQRLYRPLGYSVNNLLHMLSQIFRIGQPPVYSWRTELKSQCTHLEHKGRIMNELSQEQLQSCLGYYHDIIVVGTNDMQNLVYYITQTLSSNDRPPYLHFQESYKATSILPNILRKIAPLRQIKNGKIGVWIQLGDEHIQDRGIQIVLSTTVPKIIRTLKMLKSYEDVDVRILSPWPSYHSTHSSSIQLGAISNIIMKDVQKLSMDFTNVYEQAYPCLLGDISQLQNQIYLTRIKKQVYQRGFLYKVCNQVEQTLHSLE